MILRSLPLPGQVFDTLVVGGGAVGLTLAIRLASEGQSVCVVEAGSDTLTSDYRALNSGVQTGSREHLGLRRGRYKGLGGTTRLWGGQLMPFSPTDFLADLPNNKPGWPISFEEMSPWLDDAMRMLGIRHGSNALESRWIDEAGKPAKFGKDLQIAPSVWMKRPDFNQHFSAAISSDKGPHIVLGQEAAGLLVDEMSGAVSGLKLRDMQGNTSTLKAYATVLACGTLEVSRLLLRAKAALPQSPLGNNNHVGKWFVDHLHGVAGAVQPLDRSALGKTFDTVYASEHKITPKVRLSDAAMQANALSNCAMTINARLGPGEALSELKGLTRRMGSGPSGIVQALRQTTSSARILVPLAWRYLTSQRSGKFLSGDAMLGVEVEQLPSKDSYIELERGVDPANADVAVHWSVSGAEMAAVSFCAKATKAEFEASGLGTVELDPLVEAGDPAFFDQCTDSSHQAGGARMSAMADDGVVDRDCRVFGMPGLYVAGAATFPSGSFANPTLTAIASGLRLASHLSETAQ